VLVANRGEIARRVIRTVHAMGLQAVAIHSDPDADAPFVREADLAVAIGGRTSAESYLIAEKVLDAARRSGADAIHPGYGFLSENPEFVDAVEAAGLRSAAVILVVTGHPRIDHQRHAAKRHFDGQRVGVSMPWLVGGADVSDVPEHGPGFDGLAAGLHRRRPSPV